MNRTKSLCIFFAGYFIVAAVFSVVTGIRLGNDFNPVSNFAGIAFLGVPIVLVLLARKKYATSMCVKSVYNGVIAFLIGIDEYIHEELRQVTPGTVDELSFPEIVLISLGIGIAVFLLSMVWYRYRENKCNIREG